MIRLISSFASILILTSIAAAQAPPTNSITLNWINPTTYQGGQPLTIGQVTVFVDVTASETALSGAPTTFTTGVMSPGSHSFYVVVCDNLTPANCSPRSNTATVSVPAATAIVPAASNLTATVNP